MNAGNLNIPKSGLTLTDQVELGRRMTVLNDNDAREALILNCLPVVKTIVGHYLYGNPKNFDDMFQDGVMGVLEAIDTYDYRKNVKFTTYAYKFIVNKILTGLRAQLPIKVSKKDLSRSSLIEATVNSFYSTFKYYPTNEQIAELTSISLKDVTHIRSYSLNNGFVSFQEGLDISANIDYDDNVPAMLEKIFCEKYSKEMLSKALSVLDENELNIIQKRYYTADGKVPLKDLAREQNVSIAAIASREKSALKKLLKYFEANQIKFSDLVS